MRTANRERPLPHKLCRYTSSLCTCPASRLVWSNIKKSLYAEKAEKLIKINWFYRAEEDNQQNLLKLFFSSLFVKSFKFRCCLFVSLKTSLQLNCTSVLLILQLTAQVCCLFYFLFHGTFSKEKKSGIFGGFYFFKWALKNRVFFWLGPITWTLKLIMDV